MEYERELARISQADIGDVYNGMLGLSVTFEYESGGGQGLGGRILDASFVIRFMNAVGRVSKLQDCVGRSVWVTHSHSDISIIEPLHKKDGKIFVISEWEEWHKERGCKASYSELEGTCNGSVRE